MNRLFMILLFGGLITAATTDVNAQIPVENEPHLVNQYIADQFEDRSDLWWNALGRQLTLMVEKPYDQVAEASLQNIIYFATQHRDRINLDDANSKLVDLYRRHDDAGMRVLTLAAIHAIGDAETVEEAYAVSTRDRSVLARRVAKAAMIESAARRTR